MPRSYAIRSEMRKGYCGLVALLIEYAEKGKHKIIGGAR